MQICISNQFFYTNRTTSCLLYTSKTFLLETFSGLPQTSIHSVPSCSPIDSTMPLSKPATLKNLPGCRGSRRFTFSLFMIQDFILVLVNNTVSFLKYISLHQRAIKWTKSKQKHHGIFQNIKISATRSVRRCCQTQEIHQVAASCSAIPGLATSMSPSAAPAPLTPRSVKVVIFQCF